MPGENRDIVERIFDAWAGGDFGGGAEDFDPHVTFVVRWPFPEPTVTVGPAGISEWVLGFLKQFEAGSATFRATAFREAGDTVLVDVTQRSTGRTSGIAGDVSFFMAFTLRGGKIIRMESILDEAEALAAVGISQ